MNEPNLPRTGVVICRCGGQISARLDAELLRQQAAALPGVIYTGCEDYPCSKDGQLRLQQAIRDGKLERVMVAGCAPRLVEQLFRRAADGAGLGSGAVQIINIREQCALAHQEAPALGLQKAGALIRMGVARAQSSGLSAPRRVSVVKSAVVIGASLGGLAAARTLADANIPVSLLELEDDPVSWSQDERAQLHAWADVVRRHPQIAWLSHGTLQGITGRPGRYRLDLSQSGQPSTLECGAILIATASAPGGIRSAHGYDREHIKAQVEFETELTAAEAGSAPAFTQVVLLGPQEKLDPHSAHLASLTALRQAERIKALNRDTTVSLVFRDLYLNPAELDLLRKAQRHGVRFYRYPVGHSPEVDEMTLIGMDELSGSPFRLGFDRLVQPEAWQPDRQADKLASLLKLPQDRGGFLLEPRWQLRPGRWSEDGVFILGGAHLPSDPGETLFQAYLAAARAERFLQQGEILLEGAQAQVDRGLCTGCGACSQVCPAQAIEMEARDEVLSLARIDAVRCIGCGSCVVACPVRAIQLSGWEDAALLAQIEAALHTSELTASAGGEGQTLPRILALGCEWSASATADLAGARHLPIPANVIPLQVNCSARFDPYHILWAFLNGADGVLLGACPAGECHYGQGNRLATERVETLRVLLAEAGIDPRRLRFVMISGDDAVKYARTVTEFAAELGERVSVS